MTSLQTGGVELLTGNSLLMLDPDSDTSMLNLTGKFRPGQVYALITSDFGHGGWTKTGPDGTVLDTGNIFLKTSFDQAKAQKARFRIANEAKNYKLYSNVADFQAALDPYRLKPHLNRWDAQYPAPALLLELSGRFDHDAYTVVDPGAVKGTLSDH